jgi:DNA-binding XRE family transcriptional regulator
MADNILASSLKTVRSAMGLNQAEFADLMEVPRTTYAHHEQGNSEPSLSTMQRLIKVTGYPLEAFTTGTLMEIPKEKLVMDIMTTMAKLAAKSTIV